MAWQGHASLHIIAEAAEKEATREAAYSNWIWVSLICHETADAISGREERES
jgi:hypothetical protein